MFDTALVRELQVAHLVPELLARPRLHLAFEGARLALIESRLGDFVDARLQAFAVGVNGVGSRATSAFCWDTDEQLERRQCACVCARSTIISSNLSFFIDIVGQPENHSLNTQAHLGKVPTRSIDPCSSPDIPAVGTALT